VDSLKLLFKYKNKAKEIINLVFDEARNNLPSIIFIDQIDLLYPQNADDEIILQVQGEVSMQIRNIVNNYTRIVIIAATNIPWKLNESIKYRFQKHIYVNLPNKEERIKLIKQNVGSTLNSLTEEDYEELGNLTERFSRENIENLVRHSLMGCIHKCQSASRFKVVDGVHYVPTHSSDPNGVEHMIDTLPDNTRLRSPIVSKVIKV